MKRFTIGILAHVDSGKTTLSEAMLYHAGRIKTPGRVDNKDAYLDTFALERERGITIFSKQAVFEYDGAEVTLLDTPGHVDFSSEMERTLSVLDFAVLVISGANGVQSHTRSVEKLLSHYHIPTFVFINKMDQPGTDKEALLSNINTELGNHFVFFSDAKKNEEFYENVACLSEKLLEAYLEGERPSEDDIISLIAERKLIPVYFGSALKLQNTEYFLQDIIRIMKSASDKNSSVLTTSKDLSGRVYKITRDEKGDRLTHLKIFSGKLKVRDTLDDSGEKINGIRIYSGEKFTAVTEAEAGMVCAVTGLNNTYPGMGLGNTHDLAETILEPVLSYRIVPPEGMDTITLFPMLLELSEEDPALQIGWNEDSQEISVKLMGEIQIEILKAIVKDRFDIDIDFDHGSIVYRETVTNTVEGVGHYEPLRHYAEAHILIEPGERGSGITLSTDCSEDELDKNWQRLILTHLAERKFKGVLTGSELTDVIFTVVGGRAHKKHTEGGDFRQATYRAVRQGLMEAESVLLEPWYDFELLIPTSLTGRAMTDVERMGGSSTVAENNGSLTKLTGKAPVSEMAGYTADVIAYSKGEGSLSLRLSGYYPCHNAAEVIAEKAYDPESDMRNPSSSVFCEHGSGTVVPWNEVKSMMHVESYFNRGKSGFAPAGTINSTFDKDEWITVEEVDDIIDRMSGTNKSAKSNRRSVVVRRRKRDYSAESSSPSVNPSNKKPEVKKEKYLLVDGYNIIHAWPKLSELLEENVDSARGRLIDIMCDYQGFCGKEVIVVFDAYRVKGHATEFFDYHNIHVVYTKEAETADAYIERFSHDNSAKYDITVATSDGLEQVIIRGAGCFLLSANDLLEDYLKAQKNAEDTLKQKGLKESDKVYLGDYM